MACRKNYEVITNGEDMVRLTAAESPTPEPKKVPRLLFGVDSETQANDLLQNNLELFDWMVRNKIYPNFCGRNLVGEDCLTKEEISFLHDKGCKIAAIYSSSEEKQTEEQGMLLAKKIAVRALELDIPKGTAVFLEIGNDEAVRCEFMRGYATALSEEGYVAGFRANTDARFPFDREFSRGMQTDPDVFGKCLIWATGPSLEEYEGMTTSHLIHPDNWKPYAPSGLTRNEIAIWQYGKNCHPIEDDMGKVVTFNLDLVRNAHVLICDMF